MDIFEAIQNRQSVSNVSPDPVPHELVEKMLQAAVQAPNHYKVRPWRFVVLSGAARERLGDVMAESLKKRFPLVTDTALEVERALPLRAPLLIVVGVDEPAEPRVLEIENVCAAAAAVQNLLLAAHALDLGAKWRTGGPALDPDVKQFLGFSPNQHIIAMVYIGYPAGERTVPQRPSFEDRTTWME